MVNITFTYTCNTAKREQGKGGGDGACEKWELRNKKRLVMKPKHHSKATAKAARTAYAPRRVDRGGGEECKGGGVWAEVTLAKWQRRWRSSAGNADLALVQQQQQQQLSNVHTRTHTHTHKLAYTLIHTHLFIISLLFRHVLNQKAATTTEIVACKSCELKTS